VTPYIAPVQTSTFFPAQTGVVIVGAGIVGLTAALVLRERGVPVVVVEKGRIAAEQSARNQGWIRKTSRSVPDIPLAVAADTLWAGLTARVGQDVGYRQSGVLFLAATEAEMAVQERWSAATRGMALGSRLLSAVEINNFVPGGQRKWEGGIYTASDGRAEPSLAASAIANAAIKCGAVVVENCAARTLVTTGGRVSGIVTERGEIRCGAVLLAGGLWSRRFLANERVELPTLPLILSVVRTEPFQGPSDIAVGGPDFSFRKRLDGGYTITQRAAVKAPITLDHLLIGRRYLPVLRHQRNLLRISLGAEFFRDLQLARRWSADDITPFEKVRTMDPPVDRGINSEALRNLRAAWPVFEKAAVAEEWAGAMDVTPDSLPVIGPVAPIPGLTLATAFSGHGFGTAPAAGQLAADLVMNVTPIVDPVPYQFERFSRL